MQLPKCRVCGTRRHVKRVKKDWMRCTDCGSIWESKGFTEQERLAQFCPVCNTYVDYANWQPYLPFYSPWEKEVLRDFHYSCHKKYIAGIAKQQKEFEEQMARAEAISQITCPDCNTQSICWEDEQFYYCMQCNTEYSEEWINEQLSKEKEVKT